MSFITAMLMVLAPLKASPTSMHRSRGLAAAESVFPLIDEKAEEDCGGKGTRRGERPVEFDRDFQLQGGKRAGRSEFHGEARRMRRLVGRLGSGKTTVVKSAAPVLSVDHGEIRVDGHRLDDIRLASLRVGIALVSQEVISSMTPSRLTLPTVCSVAFHGKRSGGGQAAHALEFIGMRCPRGWIPRIGGVKSSLAASASAWPLRGRSERCADSDTRRGHFRPRHRIGASGSGGSRRI